MKRILYITVGMIYCLRFLILWLLLCLLTQTVKAQISSPNNGKTDTVPMVRWVPPINNDQYFYFERDERLIYWLCSCLVVERQVSYLPTGRRMVTTTSTVVAKVVEAKTYEEAGKMFRKFIKSVDQIKRANIDENSFLVSYFSNSDILTPESDIIK